ncbi:hypothetical protein [Streptosporangium saharense]|uniref:Uncharacterized protein n=1 Tax=Streptosporangium saharense TaxID=1706840 RepID=A0A7W7VLZ9_9ACTN|nr:hypothetical protein [Streptosporangium saharense]MBB4914715.1 hypothetical protein [Streptosporangium saharense]
MNRDLPVADRQRVRRAALRLVRRDVPGFVAMLGTHRELMESTPAYRSVFG